MGDKQKILICGDVEGKFDTLFKRVANINKKSGPFDMLLCVGNFFGDNNQEFEDYKNCKKSISVPTYILGPNKQEHLDLYPEGLSEFCPNLYYLGKRGVYNSGGGLKIAYISGLPDEESSEVNECKFSKQDVISLRQMCVKGQANFRGIDILLTTAWPKNVTQNDTKKITEDVRGSSLISWLATHIIPRYHISGLEGIYYERAPYRNRSTEGQDIGEVTTRFIGMAGVDNTKKEKWIYALNLTPLERIKLSDLYQQTTDETESPYDSETLSIIQQQDKQVQYFYNMDDTSNRRRKHDNGAYFPKKKQRQFDQSQCWFCLASPSVEKHLVISIGEQVYLALAKGGLVDMNFLILPVTHQQCLLNLPDVAIREINKFKTALAKFFEEFDKVPIFFERNFKSSHMQIQVVPIPKKALTELADIFKDEAEMHKFSLTILKPHSRLEQVIKKGVPYFWVELPDTTLYTICNRDFPIQFGRIVLASGPVLNEPGRVEWKNCMLSRDEEEQLVEKLRKSFAPYDFTV